MFSRLKSAFISTIGATELSLQYPNDSDSNLASDNINFNQSIEIEHKPYSRPGFLGLTTEETQVSADHKVRPIIVPRDLSRLPWCAGYAECINAGKSTWNEDQASAIKGDLKLTDVNVTLPYVMFSMFDGHAGYLVALTARLQLHRIILERLMAIPGDVLLSEDEDDLIKGRNLVIGAIELAYRQMDQMVENMAQRGGGGCTAITILFLNGRLYSAGAGDSRAVLVMRESERALTRDHTPASESNRIRALGFLKSNELLKGHFTPFEFFKRPSQRDLGSIVLCRGPYMTGWVYRTLTHTDLKLPLISGRGKESRVMGTIGVTRGFGDHGLKASNTGVSIKPFLSSQPEVQSVNVESLSPTEQDCIIMATDGLWDVVTEKTAAGILRKALAPPTPSLEYRLTMAAQELVQAARGRQVGRAWVGKSESSRDYPVMASVDDISVLVVPLSPYLREHQVWLKTIQQDRRDSKDSYQMPANNSVS